MSYFETNLGTPNCYYEVTEPFEAYILIGHRPSNYYIGSARLHEPIYQRQMLPRGSYLLNLHGGLFHLLAEDTELLPVVWALNEKSPFEKRYAPDHHEWPLAKLRPCTFLRYRKVAHNA